MIQPAHPHPPLVIVGAGDHGQVVADAARAANQHILGFLDDDPAPENFHSSFGELLQPDDPRLENARHIVAVGDNATRLAIFKRLLHQGRSFANVVHPAAVVSPTATLGRAVYLGPHAVVGPHAALGDAVIINSAAVVEHHNRLADAVHLAPTAATAGRVTLGTCTLVGLGAKLLPGITLGDRCTVGAGAVVTQNFPPHTTLMGIPARPVPRQ